MQRTKKYIRKYMNGLIEIENEDSKIMIAASGTAVSQSREAIRALKDEGIEVGLIKVKSIRPFPETEIQEATKNAEFIIIPEFNAGGWLAREIKASIDNNSRVIGGPKYLAVCLCPKLL